MNREQKLARADSMQPVQGTIDVDIPIDELWECFRHADCWPRWNKCFFWVRNKDLELGRKLVWIFQPIKWYLPYKMFAIATIVELEPQRKVTWEVTALPGFYARHTYHMEDLGPGRSRFGSYEKAMGWSFRLMQGFWVEHFTFVKDESLAGARRLEQAYREDHVLRPGKLPPKRYASFVALMLAILVLALGAGGVLTWMDLAYARQTHLTLAPHVRVALAGGGNSLLVDNAGEAILVDPKFGPGAASLHRWIEDDLRLRVTTVVDTHHHYDHTRGNALYPGARIVAYRDAAAALCARPADARWCARYPWAIPAGLVTRANRDAASAARLTIGDTELLLFHPGVAHTHDDVCIYLPKHDVVAIGDLLFNGYYPFIDTTPETGASLPGTVAALRQLAQSFPNATFVPGHGPLAHAADLRDYADYLEDLERQVSQVHASGRGVDDAVRSVDLRRWHRRILPSFPDDRLIPEWATAARNVRSAYALIAGGEAVAGGVQPSTAGAAAHPADRS